MAAPSALLRPQTAHSLLNDREISDVLDLIPREQSFDSVLQAIGRIIERNISGATCTIEFRKPPVASERRRMGGSSSTRQLIALAESVGTSRAAEIATWSTTIRPRAGNPGGNLILTLSTSRSISPDEEALIAAGLRLAAIAAEYRQLNSAVARHDATPLREKSTGSGRLARIEGIGERRIARDLRHAIERNELALFYQPQVCLDDRFIGMEALIRWRHPTLGTLEPDKFIAIAEDTGLIVGIGEWVISEACRQCAEWNRGLGAPVKIAVNVSALQLYFSDLREIIERSLTEWRLPANCLEIELTETAVMRNAGEAAKTLQTLRDLGVSVAIDDFGSGYSSLSYLASLPVDLLKIDRMFLRQIHTDATATVVRGIAALGHSLGLSVVAEGVETWEQWETIRTMGVDVAQGFFIGRPMHPDKALEWMTPHVRDGRSLAR